MTARVWPGATLDGLIFGRRDRQVEAVKKKFRSASRAKDADKPAQDFFRF